MGKKDMIAKSVVAATLLFGTDVAANDLGTISVESSTIDDKFEDKKEAVSNTFYIDKEDIEKINPTNVEDILQKIPGITATNVGNDRVKIHIRGVDNHRYMGEKPGVAVVIDGVPVQETTGKINLDLDNIESIKVIKGSASYLYGNDALSGAVVITTKRAKGVDSSKIESEIGSFGYKRFLATTNQGFENSALQLQATVRDTDGYWDDAYLKHRSVNGKYQYYLSDFSDITLGLDLTKRKTGDGTSVSGEDAAKNNPTSNNYVSYAGYYDTTLTKAFVTYSNDLDESSNLMVSLSRYEDETQNRATPTSNDQDHTKLSDETWIQNTLKTEYRRSFENIALMGGLSFERNSQDMKDTARIDYTGWSGPVSKGTVLSDDKVKEDIDAFYLEVQAALSQNLTLAANLRHDRIEYDYDNNLDTTLSANPDYNENSYRVGLNYEFMKDHHLYTAYSTGFRTPTPAQISGNMDILKDDPTADVPTSLDVEKTFNYEAGIRGKFSNLSYDGAVFVLDREDYLGKKAGTYIRSSNDDADLATFNLGKIRSKGIELALKSKVNQLISYELAYTFLEAKFKEYSIKQQTAGMNTGNPMDDTYATKDLNGKYVPRTPKHTLNLTVDFQVTPKLQLSPEIVAKSSYYADELNNYKQSGYGLLNLRTEYSFDESLELFAKVNNIFDKEYYQFVTVSSSDVSKDMDDATIRVAPGRSFYAGLRYKF